jgi:hypothetical protein
MDDGDGVGNTRGIRNNGWINVVYIESMENLPLSCRFQKKLVSAALIGPKPDIAAKHSMMLVSDQQDLF